MRTNQKGRPKFLSDEDIAKMAINNFLGEPVSREFRIRISNDEAYGRVRKTIDAINHYGRPLGLSIKFELMHKTGGFWWKASTYSGKFIGPETVLTLAVEIFRTLIPEGRLY